MKNSRRNAALKAWATRRGENTVRVGAALKAWETRRALAAKRTQTALKAWATRRAGGRYDKKRRQRNRPRTARCQRPVSLGLS